ncbi:MAG: hypothetical protein KDC98_08940, partial [Planctomycetes bacterium]|nr:hypothetical protein [Planctomycetota bacterium]
MAAAVCLAHVALVSGCAGPRYSSREPDPAQVATSSVSAESTLAPSLDPASELEALPRTSTAPVALRRAFLELQLGHARAAIDATSLVLYGPDRPAANEESFA